MRNALYYGDNLEILKRYIPDNFVDLIYLDPPFNSKANYNVLYKEPTGEPSKAQVTAFEDTWHWTEESERTFHEIVDTAPAQVVEMMIAIRNFVKRNDMMAYLTMMCIRLLELKRVLKDTGLIYLHCDPTASHYLKILMDTIFGANNFRNEIVWCYRGGGYPRKDFGWRHDIIFRYSRSWRLKHLHLEPKKDYQIIGEPEDLTGAKELASQNRYQFQWWALSLINARPYADKKKGADTGIDGYIYFMKEKDEVGKVIVQVKSGNISVKDIRDLGYVLEREKADIAVFISLNDVTEPMRREAIMRGFYKSPILKKDYPRMQILTISEILAGKQPDIPYQLNPYKKTEISDTSENLSLNFDK